MNTAEVVFATIIEFYPKLQSSEDKGLIYDEFSVLYTTKQHS